jgi:hypothetical protein
MPPLKISPKTIAEITHGHYSARAEKQQAAGLDPLDYFRSHQVADPSGAGTVERGPNMLHAAVAQSVREVLAELTQDEFLKEIDETGRFMDAFFAQYEYTRAMKGIDLTAGMGAVHGNQYGQLGSKLIPGEGSFTLKREKGEDVVFERGTAGETDPPYHAWMMIAQSGEPTPLDQLNLDSLIALETLAEHIARDPKPRLARVQGETDTARADAQDFLKAIRGAKAVVEERLLEIVEQYATPLAQTLDHHFAWINEFAFRKILDRFPERA